MLNNTEQFITEYEQWSKQDKYSSFKNIYNSLTPAWKERLLQNKRFSLPAFLFGPIYLMVLGGAWSGLFILLLQIFLGCLIYAVISSVSSVIGMATTVLFVLLVNLPCSLRVNKLYIKNKLAFKRKMQDFEPDAPVEWFNISSARLIIGTVLTGGIYLMYWFYRQSKAIKVSQKDNSFTPAGDGFFFYPCSAYVLRRIVRVLGNPPSLKPNKSAVGILATPFLSYFTAAGLSVYIFGKLGQDYSFMDALYAYRSMFIWAPVLATCIFCFLALIVNKYAKAIRIYCQEKQFKPSPISGWEIFWIIVGLFRSFNSRFSDLLLGILGYVDLELFAQIVAQLLAQ